MKLFRQILRSCHVSYLLSLLALVAFGPNEAASPITPEKP
ncbi:Uncharacterised protein [Edwardsiella hoshinae]|uniref:Uncharacterized protein n=1 Tax=Edwardsiella hoshinae TaxID=93378 RepID=A0A376DE22_9GAMM|nr:Uncharacterised protein [Edwardsiella hoshinae]